MGAKGSKRHSFDSMLTVDEIDAINKLMNYKEIITLDELLQKWNSYLTHGMNAHIKQLFATNKPCRKRVTHVYQCLLFSGMHHELYVKLMLPIIAKSSIKQYTTDLLETIILCLKDTNEYAYWIKIEARAHTNLQLITLISKNDVTNNVDAWLQDNPLLESLHKALVLTLYSIPLQLNLLPAVNISHKYKQSFKTILDIGWIMFIKNILPVECQENWRLLYSSKLLGESFQSLSSSIINQGSTILIIKDNYGNVFGGYASQPWVLKPTFYGDSSCFLFSLYPNLKNCVSSGHNNHFMYMNQGQYTLPNGIGMGGQMDYWGLWIDSEYGKGQCNVSCSTYSSYSMLSAVKDFKIDSLEIWCVKEKPIQDEEERRTTSSKDDWDMNLLEMAGQTKYSEGLREKK